MNVVSEKNAKQHSSIHQISKKKCYIENLLCPVKFSLKIFGIALATNGNSIQFIFIVIIIILYIINVFLLMIFNINNISAAHIPIYIYQLVRATVAICNICHFRRKKTCINEYISKLQKLYRPFANQKLRILKYWIYVIVIAGWTYFLISCTLASCFILDFNNSIVAYGLNMFSFSVAYPIITIDKFLFCYIDICCTFVILYFISLCLLLIEKTTQFNRSIDLYCKRRELLITEEIKKLHRMYTGLHEVVNGINNTHSHIVLLWYAEIIINVCLLILSITSKEASKFSTIEFLQISLYLLCYALIFFSLSLMASDLYEQGQKKLLTIHQLACNGSFRDWKYQDESLFLIHRMSVGTIALTGWNCFIIKKSFILTIIGVIGSYIIILLQATMIVTEKK